MRRADPRLNQVFIVVKLCRICPASVAGPPDTPAIVWGPPNATRRFIETHLAWRSESQHGNLGVPISTRILGTLWGVRICTPWPLTSSPRQIGTRIMKGGAQLTPRAVRKVGFMLARGRPSAQNVSAKLKSEEKQRHMSDVARRSPVRSIRLCYMLCGARSVYYTASCWTI